jgi:hypothetical protein
MACRKAIRPENHNVIYAISRRRGLLYSSGTYNMRSPSMRIRSFAVAALTVLMSASCGGGGGVSTFPTEQEINSSLDATLKSVAGDWIGIVNGPNGVSLAFKLQEGANGQVSGTGTMKEENVAAAVPITVTGTYQRPLLTLTFTGMVYEGHQATGTLQGNYTTVGGIATTMTLTGTGYTRNLNVLLQEKS